MPGVHPLVRDLYKRAILVGRDYPHPEGIEYVIREMEGTIQLKKYRAMRRRYGEGVDTIGETSRIAKSIRDIMLSSK
ncbi:hypothetical protein ACHAXH_007333 [Discostella pseudostelligera]